MKFNLKQHLAIEPSPASPPILTFVYQPEDTMLLIWTIVIHVHMHCYCYTGFVHHDAPAADTAGVK